MYDNNKDDFWNLDEYVKKPIQHTQKKQFSPSATSPVEISSDNAASRTTTFTDIPINSEKNDDGKITRFIPPHKKAVSVTLLPDDIKSTAFVQRYVFKLINTV